MLAVWLHWSAVRVWSWPRARWEGSSGGSVVRWWTWRANAHRPTPLLWWWEGGVRDACLDRLDGVALVGHNKETTVCSVCGLCVRAGVGRFTKSASISLAVDTLLTIEY